MTSDFKNPARHRADRLEWEQIVKTKLGPCRCCGQWGSSFHHLVPRSLGGDDVADNIVPLCGDGTRGCHGDVEARVPTALHELRESLRPEELRYVLRKKGGGFLERYLPLPTVEAGS
jgi:5-methylcytosine-specific restriction endonuclease McrA